MSHVIPQVSKQNNKQNNKQAIKKDKTMTLKVLLPTNVLIECQVSKVIAEAQNGSFCLLPKHIDFVAALVPGILSFNPLEERSEGKQQSQEKYVAVDIGTLVKCGNQVLVSVYNAVSGDDLNQLNTLVREHFLTLDEQQRITRSALARLEAGVIRNFIRLEEQRYD